MKLFRRRNNALVLGCGPAGLFAAHALAQSGWDFEVWSKKRRSEMFGAQYLHAPIEGLTDGTEAEIAYRLIGTPAEYQQKVYGGTPVEFVSPERIPEKQPCWDIRAAYYRAWDMYGHLVVPTDIDTLTVQDAIASKRFNLIISSIPAPALCLQPGPAVHRWVGRQIWAIGDAPEREVECPVPCPEFTVICNGEPYQSWYRVSNIYGYKTAEWATDRKPPYNAPALVTKPISTNCDCFPGVLRVGRYGRWDKRELSHMAYYRVKELAK